MKIERFEDIETWQKRVRRSTVNREPLAQTWPLAYCLKTLGVAFSAVVQGMYNKSRQGRPEPGNLSSDLSE